MTEKENERYNQYQWFLEQVEPHGEFRVEDYYGVAMMMVKRNNLIEIKLQYDYGNSNPMNGSKFETDDINDALMWIEVMNHFKIDKSGTKKVFKKYIPKEVKDYTKNKPLTKAEQEEEAKEDEW